MAPKSQIADPTTRRPGGRGAGLTKDEIVTAALRALDHDGIEALTMRRLGEDLGVQAQALYWHFKNKDALCQAVVNALGAEFESQPDAAGSPPELLRDHLRSIRVHWRRHPAAAQLGTRYVPTVMGPRSQKVVGILSELGVSDDLVLDVHRSLVWTVIGFVLIEQNLELSHHHRRVNGESSRYEVRLPFDGTEPISATLDTDALFETTLTLALGGLTRLRSDGRSPS